MESSASNIEQYFETIKEQYPDITLEHFKAICTAPFKQVKKVMSYGVLRDIRLQFLGVFEVSQSRIKYSKKALTENFENNLISEKRYTDRLKVLDSYED
jgi:hypothetical protein